MRCYEEREDHDADEVKFLMDLAAGLAVLELSWRCQLGSDRKKIATSCPAMPPLQTMHQIAAGNPRAQAKFYLLMQELHFGQVQGFEQLRMKGCALSTAPYRLLVSFGTLLYKKV